MTQVFDSCMEYHIGVAPDKFLKRLKVTETIMTEYIERVLEKKKSYQNHLQFHHKAQ